MICLILFNICHLTIDRIVKTMLSPHRAMNIQQLNSALKSVELPLMSNWREYRRSYMERQKKLNHTGSQKLNHCHVALQPVFGTTSREVVVVRGGMPPLKQLLYDRSPSATVLWACRAGRAVCLAFVGGLQVQRLHTPTARGTAS